MNDSSTLAPRGAGYELRFTGLFDRGRGFAFPCNEEGQVDVGDLSEKCRANYLRAQAEVGTEFSAPVVTPGRRG